MKNLSPNLVNNSELSIDLKIYKYALENSKIGVWDYDIATNIVTHSKESKEIFGFDESEVDLSKRDWRELIHPDDLENLENLVNEHLIGNTEEYRSEHRILRKGGSYRWVLDCGKVIDQDSLGSPTRMIGTTVDITKRKEDEVSLDQSLNIISNQNKKLTNFAHIVTHNLKEYSGNFESLLNFYDEAEDKEEKKELIGHLKTVSNSLKKTIQNLKEIVQQQLKRKIECKSLNFNEYINKVSSILDLEIANKKAIINNRVDKNLFFYSNPAYLESIVLNLASNALKYSHPDRTPVIDIDSNVTDKETIITLKDNGIGIDLKKHGNNIFGLYNTFHGNDNAEGIGLYITKNQIEALGGTISVESEVNVGTTFTVKVKHANARRAWKFNKSKA